MQTMTLWNMFCQKSEISHETVHQSTLTLQLLYVQTIFKRPLSYNIMNTWMFNINQFASFRGIASLGKLELWKQDTLARAHVK